MPAPALGHVRDHLAEMDLLKSSSRPHGVSMRLQGEQRISVRRL